MGGTIDLIGADFAKAIPTLQDGAHEQGHYEGTAVVAVRRGDDVFVVAAACTHWGENLAHGAVVGDTIRCAGHHACFSLRTGEALAAPALASIQTYRVEKRGDVRVVTGLAPAPEARQATGGATSVVIIGAGAAGAACADMLHREGYPGKVTLISADADLPCDRPNVSKDYLAGGMPEDWLFLRSKEAWADAGVELMLGTRAQSIDAKARAVKLENGVTVSYGALLLATGGDPIRLAIPGAELPHVHLLRTVGDARGVVAQLPNAKTAVVIGGSFIGLEAAASLRARGLEVHVVAPDKVPFEKVLGFQAGAMFKALHEKNGVVFHLGRKPASIDASSVTLDDGSKVHAQLVVMGVGVRPALALAESAGVKVGKGVEVDAQLRTSDANIWAAGDIAALADSRGERVRIEHWVVAQRQGQAAAKAMLGQSVKLDTVPFFWTKMFGTTLRYVGHATAWDRIDVQGNDALRVLAYRKGGRTLAVATIASELEVVDGGGAESLLAEEAMQRGDEVTLYKMIPAPS